MRVKMHYTTSDEQMYLFLYVKECPRHVRDSSAWASCYCPWLQGFKLKNGLNSGHSSIYKSLPCNEPIPLPSCSRKLCSQKRRGLSAQSDSIEWHRYPLSKPSIDEYSLHIHDTDKNWSTHISECNCISQCTGTFKSSKIINTHYHINCATSYLSKSTPSQEQETNKNPDIFAQKIMNIPYFDIVANKYINIHIDSKWPTSSTKLSNPKGTTRTSNWHKSSNKCSSSPRETCLPQIDPPSSVREPFHWLQWQHPL